MSKKLVAKTVARTLVYQLLIIWTSFTIGFLMNPEYWGNRAPIIQRSVDHIFDPIVYDDKVEKFLLKIGRTRLFFEVTENIGGTKPELFEIIKDSEQIEGEEWYHCDYQYVDKEGNLDIYHYTTRIKWKPWEFYFPNPETNDSIK